MTRLTRKAVQAEAPPASGTRKVWDSEVKGFGAAITARGARSWIVRYRNAAGQQRQKHLGQVAAISGDQARKLAAQVITAAAGGRDPLAEERAARAAAESTSAPITVRQFAERFYRDHCARQKSAAELRRKLDVEILPRIGDLELAAVRTPDIHELVHAVAAEVRQTKDGTKVRRETAANRVRALLSTMFAHAERLELRPPESNPVRRVRKFQERKRERFLTREEIARFGAGLERAVEARPSRRTAAAAIRLLFLTGCRRNEILERRWKDYDARKGILHLTDSKVGPRDVVLGAPAIQLLESLPRTSEWIFPAWRGSGRITDVRKLIEKACELAEPALKTFRPHDIRHTFASLGVRGGMNLPIVGGLLGHARTTTTEGYAHLQDGHLREAADAMQGAIAGALAGRSADVIEFRASVQ